MEQSRKEKIYKIIMLIILTAIITFLITTVIVYKYTLNNNEVKYLMSNKDSSISATLSNFKRLIDEEYLGEINEKDLLEGAIKGYIAGLNDPYTEYYTKEEMKEFTESVLGNYVGIGIYMIKNEDANLIQVLQTMKQSPAEKAGLLAGDLILKVNDVEYTSDQMTEASNKIKGEAGSKVKLGIIRGEEQLDIEITREKIKIYHIEEKVLEKDIGYLEIATFDEGCSEEFEEKLNILKQQGIKSLIIDLRNNGGGIVDDALDIADLFVEKNKTLLITKDKSGKEQITNSKKDPIINIPVVILVNKNSASASEILTGVLKDYEKATIVGTQTYGKGVMQHLKYLSDGSGLKITTHEYFTPSRNKINQVGIEPNIVVELPESANIFLVEQQDDTQLKKAIEVLKQIL